MASAHHDSPSPIHGLELMAYMGHGKGPCPYIPGQESNLLFIDGDLTGDFYRDLLDKGYRRLGRRLYRPDCPTCNECKVIRVPTGTFHRNKEQRRVWNRGKRTFTVALGRPFYTPEKAGLYRRYLRWQHGTLEGSTEETDFESFFVDTCLGDSTLEMRLTRDGDLVGVGILDVLPDALSSVYFYFDPSVARFSPGTYSALVEIDLAIEWGLDYYYLGYYIADCRTMNYKTRFRPCQLKGTDDDAWTVIDVSSSVC